MYRSSLLIGGCTATLAFATTAMAGPATGGCCDLAAGDCSTLTQADCDLVPGVYQGDNSNCSECSQIVCAQADPNCQEPNIGEFAGGTILTSAATADDVNITANGSITNICFWGAYIGPDTVGGGNGVDCGPATTNTVTVTFYDNIVSIPPAPDLGTGVTRNVTLNSVAATGQLFTLAGFNDPVAEYEFTGTLTLPFAVSAGECIWIEITNTITAPTADCLFFWEVSTEFVSDPLGDGDDISWNVDADLANDFDMAFCIDQDLGDVTTCALPIQPGCEPADVAPGRGRCILNGTQCFANQTLVICDGQGGVFTPDVDCRESCNVANPYTVAGTGNIVAGCNDPGCCSVVCAQLPFCCIEGPAGFGWDANCVNVALDVGCVESPLCGGDVDEANCQPFSTINAYLSTFDPLNAANDQFTAADDFTPVDDGSISIVCWQGVLAPLDPQSVPPNNFRITYYSDSNGFPGAVIGGPFSQGGGTLQNLAVVDTNLNIGTLDINEYTADHAPVNVTGGQCYWIEIENGVGDDLVLDGDNWFWEWAREASTSPPFYSGNGRCLVDGSPPDGYDIVDYAGSVDLAFCLKDLGPLQTPACGLDTIYLTGTEEASCNPSSTTDACATGTIPHIFTGFTSGCIDVDGNGNCLDDLFPQRRTAQPFTMPPLAGPATAWNVEQIFAFGFTTVGETNETMNYEIFSRPTGQMPQPVPADSLLTGSILFGAIEVGTTNPQEGGFPGALHAIATDFNLPPGDYYLSLWASNAEVGGIQEGGGFHWFANADVPPALNNLCADPCIGPTPEDAASPTISGCDPDDCPSTVGDAFMWRSRHWPPEPDGFGFGQYAILGFHPDDTVFDPPGDPDPDPDDTYNSSFFVRGALSTSICGNSVVEDGEACDPPGPGCSSVCQEITPTAEPCPWDCELAPEGTVGINDFLALLGQWTMIGTSCDQDGTPGVGINDFLALLAAWGPCP